MSPGTAGHLQLPADPGGADAQHPHLVLEMWGSLWVIQGTESESLPLSVASWRFTGPGLGDPHVRGTYAQQ